MYDVQWLIWYKLWFFDFTDWSIYCVCFTLEGEREWNDRYIYICNCNTVWPNFGNFETRANLMGRELKIQKIKRVHAFFFSYKKKNSFSFLWIFFFFFFFLMVLFVIIDLIVILHLFLFLTNLYRFLCILYILVFQFSITSTFSLFH